MVQKSDESYAKVEPEAKEPEEDEELSFEKEMTEDESDYDEQERDYRTTIRIDHPTTSKSLSDLEHGL